MNKSLVVLIQLFSSFMITNVLIMGSNLFAQQSTSSILTEGDMKIIQQSQTLAKKAQKVEIPNWLSADNPNYVKAEQEAKSLVQQLKRTNPTMQAVNDLVKTRKRFSNNTLLVFASYSLGQQGLKDLLRSASGKDALVVFRGIDEKANLGKAVLAIQRMAAKYDPIPQVVINPVLFKEYSVTAVPTIILREVGSRLAENPTREVARVQGLSNPDWLIGQVQSGNQGDLGVRGPIAVISEPDLIDVMKKRLANIDWNHKKHQAIKRFWKKQRFLTLPEARKNRQRAIDPSIYITKDIRSVAGEIIAKKGDQINPLDVSPFTQAVIVFDPLDQDQIDRILDRLPAIKGLAGVTRVTYIVTRLDQKIGWDSYKKVTKSVQSPVYLLTPEVIKRFELEFVPSIITANARRFIVEELAEKP